MDSGDEGMPGQHGEGITAAKTVYPARDKWVAEHPFLAGIAVYQQSIEDALHGKMPDVPVPLWDDHAVAFSDGVPLLRSKPIDKAVLAASGELLIRLVERLRSSEITEVARTVCELLSEELRQSPDAAAMLMEQTIADPENGVTLDTRANPGFVRFLCWRVLETVLRPWVVNFAQWHGKTDIPWKRPACPFCGSAPSMAQLARTKKGRERLLSCGHCGSRWSYQRTSCAFCGNHDQDKLEILELEREERFRIDVCRDCNGYIKTYTGEGEEDLLLADWTTLHLDILAGREGFQRRAGSLYEI
jgi:FdhE protein